MIGGYNGISYPFRITKQGGVAMSTTGKDNARHVDESIKQILNTHFLERVMESDIYSEIGESLFEVDDEAFRNIISDQLAEDLMRVDERIEIDADGIDIKSIDNKDGTHAIYVDLTYILVDYQKEYTVKNVRIGGY